MASTEMGHGNAVIVDETRQIHWRRQEFSIGGGGRFTPKRVTSLRCPSPRHSAEANTVPAQMLKRWRTVCNAV